MPRKRSQPWQTPAEAKLADAWITTGLSNTTIGQYLAVVRAAELWCAANDLRLRTLTPREAVDLAQTVPNTWASRRRLRSGLTAYWEATGRRNHPARAIRVPSKPQMRSKALEVPLAHQLERAARSRGDRKGLAVLLGLYLGLRRSEIAGLRWSDFDPDFKWLTIVGKGDITGELPVHPVLADELRKAPRTSEHLFPGRFTPGVRPVTIWHWVRQVAEDAQLGPVPSHVLRHTCLTTANDSTGDLRAVQVFARHARADTTAGYTRVNTKRMMRVMLSLDYERTEEAV